MGRSPPARSLALLAHLDDKVTGDQRHPAPGSDFFSTPPSTPYSLGTPSASKRPLKPRPLLLLLHLRGKRVGCRKDPAPHPRGLSRNWGAAFCRRRAEGSYQHGGLGGVFLGQPYKVLSSLSIRRSLWPAQGVSRQCLKIGPGHVSNHRELSPLI